MTHDYIRNGTTTLFAALNVLDGSVIGQCMQRHRHQEFIRFLEPDRGRDPAGKLVHAMLDNYGGHEHPKVRAWLGRHPRWTFHFTPTSCSWANAVEGFFATLTRRRLQRGVFHSLVDLQAAINRYLGDHNREPKPFIWTADPEPNHRKGQPRAPNIRRRSTLMSAFPRCRRVNSWLACKRLFQALPGRAGGAVVETTVDHTLMRGSEPHDR